MPHLLVRDLADQCIVDIGAIEGFEIFAVNQWRKSRIFLVLINDRIKTEMFLRDAVIHNNIVARFI
jgi:hypothetical protein